MNKMQFCDKCGTPLNLIRDYEKVIGICNCGFQKEIPALSFSEKSEEKKDVGEGAIKEELTIGFPHKCEKCGHPWCEITEYGPFFTDESPIYLYRCKKCNYTERQADGTSNN